MTTPKKVTIARIVQVVGEFYSVTPHDIRSARRSCTLVLARHVSMWLARTHTLHSLPVIARCLGRADHTTVLHAVRKIDAHLETSEDLRSDIFAIEAELARGAGDVVPETLNDGHVAEVTASLMATVWVMTAVAQRRSMPSSRAMNADKPQPFVPRQWRVRDEVRALGGAA